MGLKGYHDLDIYEISFDLAMEIHKITMKLPKFELHEEGSQIRRSSKSITANIVEGFGRRRYTNDFIRFLTYALVSCDETKVHLRFLHKSGYMGKDNYSNYKKELERLGRGIYNLINKIEKENTNITN